MARRRSDSWGVRWYSLLASVAFLTSSAGHGTFEEGTTGPGGSSTGCPNQDHVSRYLMLVSTLDGKVSALDVMNDGSLEWSIDAGINPLLSSSISTIEMMKSGVKTRLIPSLDGSLYQFDGKSVEALPFTADTLLSSSFRFSDDSTIVGGKDTVTYGLDLLSGKVKYVCSMEGCRTFEDDSAVSSSAEDILVIKRHTKTVRSVEMRNGMEKWNFSVGQHEISLVRNSPDSPRNRITESSAEEETIPFLQTCDGTADEFHESDEWFDFSWFADKIEAGDIDLKVIVPEGMVMALDKRDNSRILWQKKFPTSIANAWLVADGEVHEVNLFDENNVPALETGEMNNDNDAPEAVLPPSLYIGMFDNQMYVQSSVELQQEVREAASEGARSEVTAITMPRVTWRPYLATARSRTPVIAGRTTHIPRITWKPDDEESLSTDDSPPVELEEGGTNNGVSKWSDQYPFDGGYYLFPDTTPVTLDPPKHNQSGHGSFLNSETVIALWNWWKEVAAVSIIISLGIHLLVTKFMMRNGILATGPNYPQLCPMPSCSSDSTEVTVPASPEPAPIVDQVTTVNEVKPVEQYVSRFYCDFEQKACLGRGGFGIVFEAVNKMDDISYAVKRCTLSNSARARERVLREVKALAKLDHIGIVRYFNSWIEAPPPGWQEEIDRNCSDLESATPTNVFSTTGFNPKPSNPPSISPVHKPKPDSEHGIISYLEKQAQNNPFRANFDPLRPFGGFDDWDFPPVQDDSSEKNGSSDGFSPQVDPHKGDLSQSLTWGEDSSHNKYSQDDSLSEFNDSNNGLWRDKIVQKSRPFRKYELHKAHSIDRDHSCSVIFEDSGCSGDHSLSKSDTEIDEEGTTSDFSLSESPKDDYHWMEEGMPELLGLGVKKVKSRHRRTRSYGDVSYSSSSELSKSHPPHLFKQYDDGTSVKSASSIFSHSTNPRSAPKDEGTTQNEINHLEHSHTPTPKQYLYIQMQLCQRGTLKDWLADHGSAMYDLNYRLNIFDEIVNAVDYIHDSGLMHRDLKPSNIFFSLDGTVKVGDFGLVTALEEEQILDEMVDSRHGGVHQKHTDQVGTRLYMSPEQETSRTYSKKVDIYALGLILFELLYPIKKRTETRPTEFVPFGTQLERAKTLQGVRKLKFPADFETELASEHKFVEWMLDLDPCKRPTTRDILSNPLLKDFIETRHRVHRIRTRTTSSSSSNST